MLGKLMKHEFRATARLMLPLFLVVLLLSVFSRVVMALTERYDSTIPAVFRILEVLLMTAVVLSLIVSVIFAVVLMVSRFYKNLMTDEGYLMFTLPVSIHGLLWSKLLVSAVWFIATFAVDALAVSILAFESVSFDSIVRFSSELADIFRTQYGFDAAAFVLEALALLFVSLLVSCLNFYAPIAVGHSFASHKVLLSVVFYFAFSIGWQILGTVAMVSGLQWLSERSLLSAAPPAQVLEFAHGSMLTSIGVMAFVGAVMYLVTWLTLKKRLNLQ